MTLSDARWSAGWNWMQPGELRCIYHLLNLNRTRYTKVKLKLKVTHLKDSNRRQKNSHHINYKKNYYNSPFGEVTVFKWMTDSQITLCCYCYQVPNCNQTKGKPLTERGWTNLYHDWFYFSNRHLPIFSFKLKVLRENGPWIPNQTQLQSI